MFGWFRYDKLKVLMGFKEESLFSIGVPQIHNSCMKIFENMTWWTISTVVVGIFSNTLCCIHTSLNLITCLAIWGHLFASISIWQCNTCPVHISYQANPYMDERQIMDEEDCWSICMRCWLGMYWSIWALILELFKRVEHFFVFLTRNLTWSNEQLLVSSMQMIGV